jgi:hypothetical protein
MVMVHRARSKQTATSLKMEVSRGRFDEDDEDKWVFTDNPPSSIERAARQRLIPGSLPTRD